ncbi:unnamed protein product [Musa textilis]
MDDTVLEEGMLRDEAWLQDDNSRGQDKGTRISCLWSCRVPPPRGLLLLAATAVVAGEMNGPFHVFNPIRPRHALTTRRANSYFRPTHSFTPSKQSELGVSRADLRHDLDDDGDRPKRQISRIENRTGQS